MDRIEGYLDFNPVQDKIKVKEVSRAKNNGELFCFAIDGLDADYYFKECSYEDAITELIACEMYAKACIPYVSYDLASINSRYGVISKSFKRPGYRYTSGKELIDNYIFSLEKDIIKYRGTSFGKELEEEYESYSDVKNSKHTSNNFEFIIHAIDYHVKNRKDAVLAKYRILNRLSVYHLMDIIILNQDRNGSNWVVEENEDEIGLVPTFDSADAFKNRNWMALRVQPLFKKLSPTNTYIEFIEFLNRSDKRYYKRFTNLLNLLTPEILDDCIANVEKKIRCTVKEDVKDRIKNTYKEHREKLKGLLSLYERKVNISYEEIESDIR